MGLYSESRIGGGIGIDQKGTKQNKKGALSESLISHSYINSIRLIVKCQRNGLVVWRKTREIIELRSVEESKNETELVKFFEPQGANGIWDSVIVLNDEKVCCHY